MNPLESVDILIVEDNPSDAELTIRALKKSSLANHFFIAENGEEALDFLFCRGKFSEQDRSKNIKVVFLDLKLPKVSGMEVLRVLKAHEATKMLPVVIITSSKEDPDIEEAYKLGANSYVVKPVDFDSFIHTISTTGLYWLMINIPPKVKSSV